jgi:hypothetical protein
VRRAPSQKDEPRAGPYDEEQDRDPREQKEELSQADLSGVLAFGPLEVAERGKAQAANLMPLKQV